MEAAAPAQITTLEGKPFRKVSNRPTGETTIWLNRPPSGSTADYCMFLEIYDLFEHDDMSVRHLWLSIPAGQTQHARRDDIRIWNLQEEDTDISFRNWNFRRSVWASELKCPHDSRVVIRSASPTRIDSKKSRIFKI
ncbi:uncharacterized protein FOMMEDRAFT_151699 [Fomitiporia mediterranea MF3/22]|uniref:uncharacterized protein n=1 Tax=Fomitiporia mediterranea (strain MF3/22) TaxID=694068 RepID=UPI00044074EB|nr:uncharacterized protein FOMMEDRAFT_151699 [Fomitiporia mediterranea MF3/22]EJD06434.1 hypothetical protein FOMMEDRAFT_151699 [Fomitiporia mediterranea MF3/22]